MNTQYYLKLQAAQGVGAATQRAVLSYLSHHKMPFEEFFNAPPSVWKQAGLSQKQIEALTTQTPLLKQWESRLEQKGFRVLGYLDKHYPERLKKVLANQAPPVLYTWGNLKLLTRPSVGFCGSRDTSEKGVAVAKDTTKQIAKRNWSVISGNARGIDYTAHTTALKTNGYTIIVLPEGFLNFHLRDELKELVNEKNTLIISEFQPNAAWSVANAMTRNRTIFGLSDALIVIQAGTTGGTFEAGKFALHVKVPLFVADYADPNLNGPGNPYFIQKGAKAIQKDTRTGLAALDDLIYEVFSHYKNLDKLRTVQQRLFPLEAF
jgi:DNA processing protein